MVILMFDWFGSLFFGFYGNIWLEMMNFNCFVVIGLVFENVIVEMIDFNVFVDFLWNGRYVVY